MKLIDVLSGTLNDLNRHHVNIYACGPTVYNDVHIGNTRPMFLADTLTRFLSYKHIKYTFLLNITDVDDKIINRAIEKNVSEVELASRYTNEFLKILTQLNIKKPTMIVPISTKMSEMIEFISKLIEKKVAYVVDGNVYFEVKKAKKYYGNLSKQNLEALESGSRKEIDLNKKDPNDFALWKKTEVGVNWNSPWGNGRPGWHTECAVLIDHYFGSDTIDIHIGGIDLRFPHHENERIQFIAANDKELSRNWIYNGHLSMDGEKMSKSLGNVITAKDFLKDYQANELRFIYLNTNYSQPASISEDVLKQAKDWNTKIINLFKNIEVSLAANEIIDLPATGIDKLERDFSNYMRDNLNTAMAISIINKIIKDLNISLKDGNISIRKYKLLKKLLGILGFEYQLTKINATLTKTIKQWKAEMRAKNFEKADELRQKLIDKGVL